jgi:uracil permease
MSQHLSLGFHSAFSICLPCLAQPSLVPKLVGMSPAVALVTSGIGTLAYLLITKGQIPAYLGSSFAFISPIILVKATGGPGAAMVGAFMAGLVYGLIALLIRQLGTGWLMKLLPPVVVGPVIIVIGLGTGKHCGKHGDVC